MFVTIRLINKEIADINNILIFVTKLSSDLILTDGHLHSVVER